MIKNTLKDEKNNRTTKELYENCFIKKTWLHDESLKPKLKEKCQRYKDVDLKKEFMDPECMKFIAEITKN